MNQPIFPMRTAAHHLEECQGHLDISPARFVRALVLAMALSIPMWALIIWAIWSLV